MEVRYTSLLSRTSSSQHILCLVIEAPHSTISVGGLAGLKPLNVESLRHIEDKNPSPSTDTINRERNLSFLSVGLLVYTLSASPEGFK